MRSCWSICENLLIAERKSGGDLIKISLYLFLTYWAIKIKNYVSNAHKRRMMDNKMELIHIIVGVESVEGTWDAFLFNLVTRGQ